MVTPYTYRILFPMEARILCCACSDSCSNSARDPGKPQRGLGTTHVVRRLAPLGRAEQTLLNRIIAF